MSLETALIKFGIATAGGLTATYIVYHTFRERIDLQLGFGLAAAGITAYVIGATLNNVFREYDKRKKKEKNDK